MPRGEPAPVGATFVNQNGYHHTKTEEGWKATHVLNMEAKLGRKLESNEFVKFIDGNRSNFDISNLELRTRGDKKSPAARIAAIDAQIEELQAEKEALLAKVAEAVILSASEITRA
jgi:hypothetical protein